MIKLNPHQQIAVDFMKKHDRLLLYHQAGSGKTITSLSAMYQFSTPIIVVGNKGSNKAFIDDMEMAKFDKDRVTFYTFTKLKSLIVKNLSIFKDSSVIIDEAHNLRNENMYNLYIASALIVAERVILATATAIVNYMNDLSILINIVKKGDILPTDRYLFDQMFYDEDRMELINKKILADKLSNAISYYKVEDRENYPTTKVVYMPVEMNHSQLAEYRNYVKKIIYDNRDVVDTKNILNIDYAQLPNKKRNNFLVMTRQLSNSVNNREISPKIEQIFEIIKKGPYPIIVYSSFLENGIYPLAVLLLKEQMSHALVTGSTTKTKLDTIVNNYNNDNYDVLLISSAGSESLDLKKTRQIHIMEPHWNEARIDQVIGRSDRYKSHTDLPLEERNVTIYRWLSVFPSHKK